jgi:hypothetical protein
LLTADGVTYTFGLFLVELRTYFNEGAGATAWIASILAGVTLCSGEPTLETKGFEEDLPKLLSYSPSAVHKGFGVNFHGKPVVQSTPPGSVLLNLDDVLPTSPQKKLS